MALERVAEALTLRRITAIRTSGDYRYLADNPTLWPRFLYNNALARALGLWPFKDVFLSRADGTGLDGDPYAEAEALLAALSAGPVGLGDRLGRSDRDLVLARLPRGRRAGEARRADRGHRPLPARRLLVRARAAGGRVLHRPPGRPLELRRLLQRVEGAAAPRARAAAGRAGRSGARRSRRGLELADAQRPAARAGGEPRGHPRAGRLASVRAVSAPRRRHRSRWRRRALRDGGDRRIRGIRVGDEGVELEVLGTAGERVELTGWSAREVVAELWSADVGTRHARPEREGEGVFRLPLEIGRGGRCRVRIRNA